MNSEKVSLKKSSGAELSSLNPVERGRESPEKVQGKGPLGMHRDREVLSTFNYSIAKQRD